MNTHKAKLKKSECLTHRQVQYEKELDKLYLGEISPERVHERYLKLKAIKGK